MRPPRVLVRQARIAGRDDLGCPRTEPTGQGPVRPVSREAESPDTNGAGALPQGWAGVLATASSDVVSSKTALVGFSPKCVSAAQQAVVDLRQTAITSRSRLVHTRFSCASPPT